jgi:transcriptional regulator NrdR family protein
MNAVMDAMPREVIKRDGRRAAFDAARIRSALQRAGQASGEFGADEADLLTAQVLKVLAHSFRTAAPGL